jgi:hypothetical protein
MTMLDVPEGAVQADGSLVVSLTSPVEFEVDRLFYGTYADVAPEVVPSRLVAASHTIDGSVAAALDDVDGGYAEVLPGEAIELEFAVPPARLATDRYYALLTHGRYEHLDGRDALPGPAGPEERATVAASAWPNPSASGASVRFDLPAPGGFTTVRVYDLAGRVVRELGRDDLPAGTYELTWDGRNERGATVGAGVYFFRIETGKGSVQKKVVVVR